MSKRKRVLMIVLIIVCILLIAGLAFVGNFFYEFSLTPRRNGRAPGVPQGDPVDTSGAFDYSANEEWMEQNAYDVWIDSADGLRLHGYRVDQAGGRYAILVHGYTSDGIGMAHFGKHFYERGFSLLMPDMRGHGQSEGHYIGMGWHDRLDVVRWIDSIIADDPDAEIMLFGISMGGATVMMTSGEDLPPNVKLIIEDCGYSSVWDEFAGQLQAQFGLPTFPFLQAASVVTRLRAGYWLSEADAVKQIAKCEVPILFLHGEDDTFVPFWMLEPLYEAATCPKEKLVVPGAGHGMASTVDPEGYWSAVDTFIDRHMGTGAHALD